MSDRHKTNKFGNKPFKFMKVLGIPMLLALLASSASAYTPTQISLTHDNQNHIATTHAENTKLVVQQLKSVISEKEKASLPLEKIKLPPGFKIELFAENLPYARSLALSPNGTLFVGTLQSSENHDSPALYAIADTNNNNHAEAGEIFVLAKGLNYPNGVAFKGGSLYVAEINRIIRFDDIEAHLDSMKEPALIKELPQYLHHGFRYIGFGPDGKLYLAMGAACNVCFPTDEL